VPLPTYSRRLRRNTDLSEGVMGFSVTHVDSKRVDIFSSGLGHFVSSRPALANAIARYRELSPGRCNRWIRKALTPEETNCPST